MSALYTYEETAEALGMTPYQVRDIEHRAMRKLRANAQIQKLAKVLIGKGRDDSPFYPINSSWRDVEEA